MESVFQTRGLTKHYGQTVGIEDLNLELRPGEILGFLGPNGSGKTTTIRLLLGFLRPTRGEFSVFGEEIAWGDWRHRARIGFLPGDLRLPRRMTGRRLLRFLARLTEEPDPAWLGGLVDRLDVPLDRRIRALSRGNLQKLGLVQALMHRPDLTILDEPTTGLDPLVQRTVLDTLREMRDAGSTVFFSSHNITEVEKVCDRVAFVRGGRLVVVESVSDLRRRLLARVELQLGEPARPGQFDDIEGVVRAEVDGRSVTLTVKGRPGALLRRLSEMNVEELRWRTARLEDHFFDFYGETP